MRTIKKVAFALLPLSLLISNAYADSIDLTDLTKGDPFFYTADQNIAKDDGQSVFMGEGRPTTTHSQVPHLPVYMGYMHTNYTYRFISISEQVLTMMGDGKHGVWRVQEQGTIREYLKPGATGIKEGEDIFADANKDTVANDYAPFIEGGESIYRFPDERVTESGHLAYIDLPITHPKYEGKYDDHEPIDLANYFCTMSGPDFPYSKQAMNFAFQQAGGNQVGPLGKRAGLDIKENYTNVLRLKHLPDARSWINVGQDGKDELHPHWESIDTEKTNAEYYIFERPFFGVPYLFLTAVFDNVDNQDFQYVRPDGPYFETLKAKNVDVKTEVTQQPVFHLDSGESKKSVGLPVFGVHHPNRAAFGGGGACPLKGGDWGRYPETTGGSGWPTQYEEITPMCDALLIDIKFYSNLDGRDWSDPNKYLANSGVNSQTVEYTIQPGDYGKFTDEYNVKRGAENPDRRDLPEKLTITFAASEPSPVTYNKVEPAKIDYSQLPATGTTCRPVANAS
ncbi:MAG TPA: hypothetical protein VK026_02185 [Paenalcaligenes sp.]|nr:hypothetical protein [Paenalcaligenes sp.]